MKAGLAGFALGSLVLAVVGTLVRAGAPGRVAAGGGVVLDGLRKFLSPQVPGVPKVGWVWDPQNQVGGSFHLPPGTIKKLGATT